MFEIKYIKLNYTNPQIPSTIYEFKSYNYIFGENNVGKTVMLQSIDYVLGKSNFSLDKTDGLDGILSIEAKLQNEGKPLFVFRSKDNSLGYKLSEQDNDYLVIDEETYKKEISGFINGGSSKLFEEFKEYMEEDLTFRAFSFLNFLDEKGLGYLTNIFTRVDNYYNQKRAEKLMTFLFNYDNVSQLLSLTREEKLLQDKLREFSSQKETYIYLFTSIIREFRILQLPYKSDSTLQDLRNTFISFRDSFNRELPREDKKDLAVLMKVSYSLAEEIKYQESLEHQAQFVIDRNKKAEQLLSAFKDLVVKSEKYAPYVDEIEALINRQQLSYAVLSVKDYKSTIDAIKEKKLKVDQQLRSCQQGLTRIAYWDTIKSIGRLEQFFSEINELSEIKEVATIEERLHEIHNDIKNIKNTFDKRLKDYFDNNILLLYSQLKESISFAQEDFAQTKFSIKFDPLKISIAGQKAKSEKDDKLVSYNPGSMARETTWQVLAYLVMQQIIQKHFKEMPIMPVLFIDGLNQPYDESPDNYSRVCNLIKTTAQEIGIQLFIVSTKDTSVFGDEEKIHLIGFNKAHRTHS